MSVRKNERNEGKLEVHAKAEELVSHTVHIVSNPNVFDPRYDSFHGRIVDTAVSVGCDLWEANGIYVKDDPARYAVRRDLQDRAIRNINVLLYLMTVAKRLDKKMRSSKYRHWVSLARTTRALAVKWRDSDARRYGHLVREAG